MKTAAYRLALVVLWTALACFQTSATTHAQSSKNQPQPRQKLPAVYQNWLSEDVRWIIHNDELHAFRRLTNDADRDRFVEQFWESRNPTPGRKQNAFKEEHYRRIAYAKAHFATAISGYRTDRGRVYIVYGPPDEIVSQPLRMKANKRTQLWRYRSLPPDAAPFAPVLPTGGWEIRFTDECDCGNYRLQSPRRDEEPEH
jgi:GWxTD domain-containing protein